MIKAIEFFQNDLSKDKANENRENLRSCPECGKISLKGMPGGRDSVCYNCGYKDPCCYD